MTYGVVHDKSIAIYANYKDAKRWYQNAKLIYKDIHIYELTEVNEYNLTHSLGAKVN